MAEPLLGRWAASPAALIAGIAAAAVAIAYLALIGRQGEGFSSRAILVAGWIVGAAVLATAAAFTREPRRRALFAGIATAMLVVVGIAGLASIGFALLLVALLAGSSASVASEQGGIGAGGRIVWLVGLLVVAGLILAAGFQLTA